MATSAMGASSRPPDLGASSRPPDLRGNHTYAAATGTTPRSSGTSAQAGARPASGEIDMNRSYAQIIKEASSRENILIQISMEKMIDNEKPDNKPMNLTDLQVSQMITDVLKISLADCLELDSQTGRYEKRELLVSSRANTNAGAFIEPTEYRRHMIKASVLNSGTTKVTFRGVPISVPNEELVHLCSKYGKTDGIVHRQYLRLGNEVSHDIVNSTRTLQVQLHPGKYLKNFYWLSGPSQGERGRRVTVLHANQPPQCSNCFRYSPPPPQLQPQVSTVREELTARSVDR